MRMFNQQASQAMDDLQHLQQLSGSQKLISTLGSLFEEAVDAPKQGLQTTGVHDIGELHNMRKMPGAPPQQRLLASGRKMQGLMKD